MKTIAFAGLVIGLLLIGSSGTSQVLAPELGQKQVEVGFAHIWSRRDMERFGSQEFDWEDDVFFIRYGIIDRLTVWGEGSIWDRGKADRFPGRDYRVYNIGIGFTLRLLEAGRFRVAAAAVFSEGFWFDRSASKYHKEVKSKAVAVWIEGRLYPHGQEVSLWGGPAYAVDEYVEYPWGTHREAKWKSADDFGGAFGINVFILRHVDVFSHIVYAGYLQPRTGIGWRF